MRFRWLWTVAALGLGVALLFGGGGVASSAPTACTLAPVLQDATVNQGLGSYGRLVRGKETLVRLYLSLPSCASRTSSIQVTGGTLAVKSGATTLTTIQSPTPTPTTTFPSIAAYSAAASLDSPGDPKFVVPGSALGSGPSGAYTASFSATISYKNSAGATGSVTFTTLPSTGAAITKDVTATTNPLRVLVVPMGDALRAFDTQFPAEARGAVENGMQTLSRLFPVRDGVGDLGSTTAGLRYTINPTLLDLSALLTNGRFCGSGGNFNAIKGLLAQFMQSWNTANPSRPADRVLGAVSSTISDGGASVCAEGMASTNSPEAWVRAIPDGASPSMTGALMGMELGHTFGTVPAIRGDGAFHSINLDADTTAPNRGYNVSARSFLVDDHTVMTLSAPWNNTNTLLERDDYADIVCKLGGPATSTCTAVGTVGTAGADPTFVISGTTDGTPGGTSVVESYFSTNVPRTPTVAASDYKLVFLNGTKTVAQANVGVSFGESLHDQTGPKEGGTVQRGLFSAAVPFNTNANRIELRNGTTVLYARTRGIQPSVTSTTVSGAAGQQALNYTQNSSRDDVAPAVSPNGGWIAWELASKGSTIVIAPSDDSSKQLLIPSAFSPGWSPDGSKLVYVSQQGGAYGDIFTVPVNTSARPATIGTPVKVYDADGETTPYARNPDWSPDGGKIAFDGNGNIFTVPAPGGSATQLTTTGDASDPSWSRTAGDTRIAYQRSPASYFRVNSSVRAGATAATGVRKVFATPKTRSSRAKPARAKQRVAAKTAKRRARVKAKAKRVRSADVPGWVSAVGLFSPSAATVQALNVTFVVDSAGDEADATPDGVCATSLATCTLRAAIEEANGVAGQDTITFNIGGSPPFTITPGVPGLPAITDAVTIDATTQAGWSSTSGPVLALSGSAAGPGVSGFRVTAGAATIRGFAIGGFSANGITIEGTSSNSIVEGNYIGTNLAGTAGAGNGFYGVYASTDGNVIGTLDGPAWERNVISGNADGVRLTAGASGNQVSGNFVGTDASGTGKIPNSNGIVVDGTGNTIGGSDIAGVTRNVVSGNGVDGIAITSTGSNTVLGNYVGTTVGGNAPLGNGGDGISVLGTGSTIGGTAAAARNVVGSSGGHGIFLYGATGVTVQGNYVGVGGDGTTPLTNGIDGIAVDGGSGHTIGGTAAGAGNLTANNTNQGIALFGVAFPGGSSGNTVQGNISRNNGGQGILAGNSSDNTIGGTATGAGNTVYGNAGSGVLVNGPSLGNSVRGNAVYQNGGLGIALGTDGVTPNDPQDADSGPNNLQNYPVIDSALNDSSGTTITGTLSSAPSSTYTIDIYSNAACDGSGYGEGAAYRASGSVTTNVDGQAPFTIVVPAALGIGEWATATATDAGGNTSELSSCVQVAAAPTGPPPVTGNEIWTLDPAAADPEGTAAKLVSGREPSWDVAAVAYRFDNNGNEEIRSIKPDGTGDALRFADGQSPSLVNGVLAFQRYVVGADLEFGDWEIMLVRGGSLITVQVSDDNPQDLRLDLFLNCDGTRYPIAVGLLPKQVSATGATFEYVYDPSIGCTNGTIEAVAADGYWRTTPSAQGQAPITTGPKPPVAAIYVPFAGQRLLQYSAIPLSGAGNDPDDGALTGGSLRWTVRRTSDSAILQTKTGPAQNLAGAAVDLTPPAGGWPVDVDYTVELTVTDSDGETDTATFPIRILGDNDNDGLWTGIEPTACGGSGDDDPTNAYTDADGDGVPNLDEAVVGSDLCVGNPPALKASTITFDPSTLYVPSNGNTVTVYVKVPGQNLAEVVGGSVRITRISGRGRGTYDATTDPAFFDFTNLSWSVSGTTGTAKFDRQALNSFLLVRNLVGTTVTVTVAGRSANPAWRFEGPATFTSKQG